VQCNLTVLQSAPRRQATNGLHDACDTVPTQRSRLRLRHWLEQDRRNYTIGPSSHSSLESSMAVGTIVTVLANIPWGTVVENAPKIADSATKLWDTVARWTKSEPEQNAQINVSPEKPMSETQLLSARLQTLEESVRNLNEQMQASSGLIKALAEQNTLLVQRVELNRVRLVRLVAVAGSTGALLLAFNIYLLFRH
jgi:hypothetical protein